MRRQGSGPTGGKGCSMINFEYRSGILEGADPATGTEFCWFRGDEEITVAEDCQPVGVIAVKAGATVTEAKAAIRAYGKR